MEKQLVMNPVQWSSLTDIDVVKPISANDYDCLNEIKDVLVKHGMVDRFGVTLIHRHFELDETSEVVMEYTDQVTRTQVCKVERRDELPTTGRIIETQWCFDKASATLVCHSYCHNDYGHVTRHQQM